MKRSSYSTYFTSISLLALVMLTSSCSQPGERVKVSDEDSGEVSQRSAGDTQIIMLPGELPLEMVWIPPGSFLMGSPDEEQDRSEFEGPQYEVTHANGFWMGKYPITQEQWQAVMGNNPSHFNGDNRSVELVFWNDIRDSGGFLDQLNEACPGYNFRLPSEAEWEYAYRAGTTTRFYWGDDPDYTEIGDYAWYLNNSLSYTHPVGQKLPNAWGLYDMAGNAWEWCEDDWHNNYEGAPSDGSAWVDSPRGGPRLLRGGSWSSYPSSCRAASRGYYGPARLFLLNGFRVVCDMD